MPTGRSGKPPTCCCSAAGKDQAVRLVCRLRRGLGSEHGTMKRVAGQLGCGVNSVRWWVRERDVVDGLASPDAQRARELEAKNNNLTQEVRELRRVNEMAV